MGCPYGATQWWYQTWRESVAAGRLSDRAIGSFARAETVGGTKIQTQCGVHIASYPFDGAVALRLGKSEGNRMGRGENKTKYASVYYRFRYIAAYWSKTATPLVFGTPVRGEAVRLTQQPWSFGVEILE